MNRRESVALSNGGGEGEDQSKEMGSEMQLLDIAGLRGS